MSCPHCHGPDKYVLDKSGDYVPSGEYEHSYSCITNWPTIRMLETKIERRLSEKKEEIPELIDRIIKEDSWDLVRVETNNFQVTEIIDTETTYRAAQSIQGRPRPDNDLLCIVRPNQYKVGDRWVG